MRPDFYTLPQAMYNLDVVKCLLTHKNNAILHKRLTSDMLDMEKIILSHSLVYINSGTVKIQTFEYEEYVARVSECAAEYGYANSSNFIKVYKEIYHETPKQHTMT